jgi:hypothetical protein
LLAEKFDYYDAIAHLIPGTIGCIFLLYALDLLGIALPKPDMGALGAVGIGVAVAYTVGHLLQSLASSFEPMYYAVWGGKPSNNLLSSESRQFSEQQRQQLLAELTFYFGVKEMCPKDHRSAQNFYHRLFERCMTLCNRNKIGRVGAFNAIYGFHRVLLTTFLLGFISYSTIWILQRCGALDISSTKTSLVKVLIVLTGMGTWIEIFRARKRAYHYAQEVLWMTSDYIRDCPFDSKETRASKESQGT